MGTIGNDGKTIKKWVQCECHPIAIGGPNLDVFTEAIKNEENCSWIGSRFSWRLRTAKFNDTHYTPVRSTDCTSPPQQRVVFAEAVDLRQPGEHRQKRERAKLCSSSAAVSSRIFFFCIFFLYNVAANAGPSPNNGEEREERERGC